MTDNINTSGHENPIVVVIAGPNGAGKSTIAPYLLNELYEIDTFVNADTLAQGLSYFQPEQSAYQAGRLMLRHLKQLAVHRKSFAFETTLASRIYAAWIEELKTQGYSFHLNYLWISSVEIAVKRVKERVNSGGHSIPDDVIRRRFARGFVNLTKLYQPISDTWRILDSDSSKPETIATGCGTETKTVYNQRKWNKFIYQIEVCKDQTNDFQI